MVFIKVYFYKHLSTSILIRGCQIPSAITKSVMQITKFDLTQRGNTICEPRGRVYSLLFFQLYRKAPNTYRRKAILIISRYERHYINIQKLIDCPTDYLYSCSLSQLLLMRSIPRGRMQVDSKPLKKIIHSLSSSDEQHQTLSQTKQKPLPQ